MKIKFECEGLDEHPLQTSTHKTSSLDTILKPISSHPISWIMGKTSNTQIETEQVRWDISDILYI